MRSLFGALTFGSRDGADACSTVESRTVDERRLYLLLAVTGDLATATLESVKGAFVKVASVDAAAAAKLVAAAPPPPYAAGVAVVLLANGRAAVATAGHARCYRERAGPLEELAPGVHDLVPGDVVLAASHSCLPLGRPFFVTEAPRATDDTFRNDSLDSVLEAALANAGAKFVSVAAARTEG